MKAYQADLTEHGKLPLGRGFKPTNHQLLVREMILLLKRGYLDVDLFPEKFRGLILRSNGIVNSSNIPKTGC